MSSKKNPPSHGDRRLEEGTSVTLPRRTKLDSSLRIGTLSWDGEGTEPWSYSPNVLRDSLAAAANKGWGVCDLIVAAGITFANSPPAMKLTPTDLEAVLEASDKTPVLFEAMTEGNEYPSWFLAQFKREDGPAQTVLRERQIVSRSGQVVEMAHLACVIASGEGVIDFEDTDLRLVLLICGENNLLQPDSGPSVFRCKTDGLEKVVGGTWAVLNPAHTPYYPQNIMTGFAKVGEVHKKKGNAGPTLKKVVEEKTFGDGNKPPVAVIHVNNFYSDIQKRDKTVKYAEAFFGERVSQVHGPVTGSLDGQGRCWQSSVFEIRPRTGGVMAEKEVVLDLGVEGGGATVFRTPLGSGGWQFHVKGSSMPWDDSDDESWQSWQSEPVPSIEEALKAVAKNGSWVFFYPLTVHPEYRTIVWELAQAEASKLVEGRNEMWERRRHDWQHLCQQEQ